MKITFHGATRTVTGSQHLLEVDGRKLLLDCGLYQGRRKDELRLNKSLPYRASEVEACILSHAHIDHSGNLPNLVKQGFEGPIHATRPTVDLSRHMLLDSAKIQEHDAAYWTERNKRRGLPPVEPIYTTEDVESALGQFVGHPYRQRFEVAAGVTATFRDAGHILGSAITVLDIDEVGRRFRLVFSGDLGRRDTPLLRDPVVVQNVDHLILESTYGNRRHEPHEKAYDKLRELMSHCCSDGGKLIIPSFAVGRAQDLIYNLHRMMDHGEIPRVPVYVDSPLAVNITTVFRKHTQFYDEEAKDFAASDAMGTVLDFPELTYISSVDESKALNRRDGPHVIISSAGMANAGRVLHHLRHGLEDKRNTILFVSWQAPHTLGRRLVEGKRKVKIFGDEFRVRAEVKVINGFSAHADSAELLEYVSQLSDDLRSVFLVHGEEKSSLALKAAIHELGIRDVFVPDLGQSFEV